LSDQLRIESLTPQPQSDGRRVTLVLRVSGLPAYGPGGSSHFFNFRNSSEAGPPKPERRPSPFPDITLSILDQHGHEMAATYIVEHKEPELDFTLHVPIMEPDSKFIARAEMTKNGEVIQVVEVPFNYAGDWSEDTRP
jgi:hypothetical protein